MHATSINPISYEHNSWSFSFFRIIYNVSCVTSIKCLNSSRNEWKVWKETKLHYVHNWYGNFSKSKPLFLAACYHHWYNPNKEQMCRYPIDIALLHANKRWLKHIKWTVIEWFNITSAFFFGWHFFKTNGVQVVYNS